MKGGLLMPRVAHHGKPTTAPLKQGASPREDSSKYVYLTTNKELAWVYAWCAVGRGKPRVVTVAPLDPVYPDPEHSSDMQAFRTKAAIVVEVDIDPMVTEIEARTGWVDA
jgi:hypothetical protein